MLSQGVLSKKTLTVGEGALTLNRFALFVRATTVIAIGLVVSACQTSEQQGIGSENKSASKKTSASSGSEVAEKLDESALEKLLEKIKLKASRLKARPPVSNFRNSDIPMTYSSNDMMQQARLLNMIVEAGGSLKAGFAAGCKIFMTARPHVTRFKRLGTIISSSTKTTKLPIGLNWPVPTNRLFQKRPAAPPKWQKTSALSLDIATCVRSFMATVSKMSSPAILNSISLEIWNLKKAITAIVI